MSDDAQKRIQDRLAQAQKLLAEAGLIADEEDIEYVDFMGLTYERTFGWFHGEDLVSPSEWNASECVIGSVMARRGMRLPDGWQESSSCFQDW